MEDKGQATLEFSLMLLITVMLVSGFVVIQQWVNGHILPRQDQYEIDRLQAGQKDSAGTPVRGYITSKFGNDQVYYFNK